MEFLSTIAGFVVMGLQTKNINLKPGFRDDYPSSNPWIKWIWLFGFSCAHAQMEMSYLFTVSSFVSGSMKKTV